MERLGKPRMVGKWVVKPNYEVSKVEEAGASIGVVQVVEPLVDGMVVQVQP